MLVFYLGKLPNQEAKVPPDSIILDIWALLRFMSVYILLAKVLLTLIVCLVVRNTLCGKFSSWKSFLFILNIVPVLFFAAEFNFFSSVFSSLILTSWKFSIIYNTVTIPAENFNLASLIFSKVFKENVDWPLPVSVTISLASGFFNCLANSICWITFGSAFNSFFLLKLICKD